MSTPHDPMTLDGYTLERVRTLHGTLAAGSYRLAVARARLRAGADLSDVDLRAIIDQALRLVEPSYLVIEAVTPSEVVYSAMVSADQRGTFRRTYTLTGERVTVGAERTEVRPSVRYVPAEALAPPPPRSAEVQAAIAAHEPPNPYRLAIEQRRRGGGR
jgi:hypothetical protein